MNRTFLVLINVIIFNTILNVQPIIMKYTTLIFFLVKEQKY